MTTGGAVRSVIILWSLLYCRLLQTNLCRLFYPRVISDLSLVPGLIFQRRVLTNIYINPFLQKLFSHAKNGEKAAFFSYAHVGIFMYNYQKNKK